MAAAPDVVTAPDISGMHYIVLVFTKSVGQQHPSTPAGAAAIRQLGHSLRFSTQVTNDARKFEKKHLKHFSVVVFLNTSGDVLNAAQQAAFEAHRSRAVGATAGRMA